MLPAILMIFSYDHKLKEYSDCHDSQVGLLLHVASVLVYSMWERREDPDNSAIPYLTALGDLLGGILLASVFHLLEILK